MTAPRLVAALALVFALAHVPFLASSLEDIDSVNFALGVRHFDVAQHQPHPPGYPIYMALGKAAKAVAGAVSGGSDASREARALAVLSLLSGLVSILCFYNVFASLNGTAHGRPAVGARPGLDVGALSATAIMASCPLFWYLASRPMSDLPGLALAAAAQACLLAAWWRQTPAPDGDRRLPPADMAASGRMIVLGAFLAAFSIGLRSQTVWLTFPLLLAVLGDRIGRGAAGAMMGGGIMFVVGGLLWGIPLLIASGGLNAYLAALGTQAGEDFTGVEMLYLYPTPRVLAFALLRTFVSPWDSTPLAVVVLVLAAAGLAQVVMRNRRAIVPLFAMAGPYLAFHLVFQDTPFIRYALPLIPAIAFLATRGISLISTAAVPMGSAAVAVGSLVVAAPVLAAYAAEPSPAVRAVAAMNEQSRTVKPGALAMHQTYVRPLQAEDVAIPQLAAPPRLEWLEAEKYWKDGHVEPLWFLADPMRSDLALIDPASRRDATSFAWPIASRPAFGGLRPVAATWYRMATPGWFAEDGWSLTPETSGMSRLRKAGPHLGPISARVRRRDNAVVVMIGGRHLGAAGDPAVRFTMAMDGQPVEEWEAGPGFFLKFFEIPAGRLQGTGWSHVTVQSTPVTGTAAVETAIEQFNVQDAGSLVWGYGEGWQEAEFNQTLGVWRWTSDRSTLRIVGPPQPVRVTLKMESPLRYFTDAPVVHARAGSVELASTTVTGDRDWTFDVPASALAASSGGLTIETDKTFVPADRGNGADHRRLGLRIFAISVANSLTAAENPR